MTRSSPATRHLLKGSALATIPSAIFVAVNKYFDLGLPSWLFVAGYVATIPLTIACKIHLRQLWVQKEARRLGAVTVPRWDGTWIGNVDVLLQMARNFREGHFGAGLFESLDEFGPIFNLRILWEDHLVTSEAEHIKRLLSTEFTNFEKGSDFREAMYSLLGTGVFNFDGEMWKFHRSMTRPFFSRERIGHFDLFDRHSEIAITKMKERLHDGFAVNFQDVVSRFTLDSASEFLFGSCVESLSADLPFPHHMKRGTRSEQSESQADKFVKAFANAQLAVARRLRRGWFWSYIEIFTGGIDEDMKIVDQYLKPIVANALLKAAENPSVAHNPSMEKEVDEDETLLDHLVKLTKDPAVLHDETLNILLAGRDTTAATLTFAVYFLCTHPHVLARLRAEIMEHVGPTAGPTHENIRDMKYLRAVLNETLRLYPAVPVNVRHSEKAVIWPNPDPNGKPIYIPADTEVGYGVVLMHRRKDYWGPDAEEFDPDRFIDERLGKYLVPNPFIFLPFNAGPRICLGQQFAYHEMSFFLIRLLQTFSAMELDLTSQPPGSLPPSEWTAVPDGTRKSMEKIFPKVHLTMYSEGGLWVKMTAAS